MLHTTKLSLAVTTQHILLLIAILVTPPILHAAPERGVPAFVGFAQDTLANDWRLAQVKGVERRLAGHPGIRFIYSDGKGSTAKQISDIEDMIAAGVDILIASPRDGKAMTPVISKAYRQGIKVILLTRSISSDEYTTFISPDDDAIARQAVKFLAERLKGNGRILVLQGVPSSTTAIRRTRAFNDELRHYPGLSVAAIKPANYLRSDAIKAMEEVLQLGIGFDAIYAQSDSMASGARIVLKQAGIEPKQIVTVGIDYISEAREAIRSGEQHASFVYPTCAAEAVNAVLAIVAGRKVTKHIQVPTKRVTPENVERVAPIF